MKANFALSLSYEGIRLLHRAADGWRRVGEVDLAVADLSAELGALRSAALALEPDGLRTKLIIPGDQIKYLSLNTGELPEIDRRIAARKALDGATPYAVEDLSFDVAADGDTTLVAAVARETLGEAESFAVQHGFEPISFVAVSEDGQFLGEPYFGPAQHAATLLSDGEKLTLDTEPTVAIGDALDPDFLSLEEIENAPDIGDDDGTLVLEARSEVAVEPAPEPTPAAPEAEPIPDAQPEHAFDPASDPADATEPMAEFGFSSRRRAPELGGVTRDGIAPAPSPTPPPTAPEAVIAASLPEEDPGFTTVGDEGEQVRARFNPLPDPPLEAEQEHHEPDPAPSPEPQQDNEQDRMTIFGAREAKIGGKPRFLGLTLTVILLIFLVGVAAWARVYFDEEISRLFSPRSAPEHQFVAVDEPAPVPEEPRLQPVQPAVEETQQDPDSFVSDADVRAALEESLPEEPALLQPEPVTPPKDEPYTEDAARTYYARTGIWAVPPQVPSVPEIVQLDDLYVASIDAANLNFDAVALGDPKQFDTDANLRAPVNPQPPEVRFAFDENGLLIPTPEGAISPEGYRVYAGKPPKFPTNIPERIAEAPVLASEADLALAAFRPVSRPEDLIENTERHNLGGLTRSELAAERPRMRPENLVAAVAVEPEPTPEPEAAPEPDTSSADIERAIASALRPEARPRNFGRIVDRAAPRQPAATAPAEPEAQVAAIKPRTVKPSVPSRTSVTKQATVRNALNLNRINLLGVSGKPASRQALVRLANGRIKKVKVGDRIDGGRVSAIGDGELRYRKGSRNIVLKMPKT